MHARSERAGGARRSRRCHSARRPMPRPKRLHGRPPPTKNCRRTAKKAGCWKRRGRCRPASRVRRACCRWNRRSTAISCRSRTAGGSAIQLWDRYGPDHSVLCPHDPFYQDAPYAPRLSAGIRTTRTCSRATTRSSASTRFLNVTATSLTDVECRQVPTPTTPFESDRRPGPRRVLRQPEPVLPQPGLFGCRSICSTATRRSSRPTGG